MWLYTYHTTCLVLHMMADNDLDDSYASLHLELGDLNTSFHEADGQPEPPVLNSSFMVTYYGTDDDEQQWDCSRMVEGICNRFHS